MINSNEQVSIKQHNGIRIEDDMFQLNYDIEGGIHLDEDNNIVRKKGVIQDCYVCVRPGNKKNVPKVYLTQTEKNSIRIIANNYGHGGIGWSTLWGSALKAIELVEDVLGDNFKNEKFAVIGAGCVACGTVLLLLDKGIPPENIQMFSESAEWITSHRSGAFLSCASVLEKIDSELEKLYTYVNIYSYLQWEKIERGQFLPGIEGLVKIKAYFGAEKEYGTIETDSGLDILVEHGLLPQPELVYLKFNDRLNLMRKYDGYYFNTYKLMKGFYDIIFNQKRIKLNLGKIENFDQIPQEFGTIFNCTGLGNQKALASDPDIHPIAGHIITMRNQDMSKLNYVIYTHYIYEEDKGKVSHTDAPLYYFMPKTDDTTYGGFLGGTLMHDYSGGDKETDEREYRGIIRRTLEIFGRESDKFK